MSCKIPPEVEEYLQIIETEQQRVNAETKALAAMIRRIFGTEDITVDEEKAEHYLSLEKYLPYKLFPWQRALTILWLCTYRSDGQPRFTTAFCMLARGAGKDGTIAFNSFCLVSPFNRVQRYNVDICANNEEQAVTPLKDLVEVLETPSHESRLKRHFYHTKELVQGRWNKGIIKGRTNNPKGRDGMRSGAVIFNEVHAFQNYDNIKVFRTGQGKVAEPRVGIFSSNGDVSDGPLDDYLRRGREILLEGLPDNGFLPLIYCLPNLEAVHDPLNWTMANPSLAYLPNLMLETETEYREWLDHPEQNGDFITKRMGLRQGRQELAVTDYEKVKATNRPLPELAGRECVIGIDYAQLSDMAAVDIHFKEGNFRYDICRAWLCLKSKDLPRIKAPWQDWANRGLLYLVDDVNISPQIIAEYVAEACRKYDVKKIAMDNFRWGAVADAFRAIGIDAADKSRVKLVRNSDIYQVEQLIQLCFDMGYYVWGDNVPLRWAVNNTKRMPAAKKNGGVDTGNFYYAKIEPKSRKNDPFMAVVAAMTIESELSGDSAEWVEIPEILI